MNMNMSNYSSVKHKGSPAYYVGNYHLDIGGQSKKGSKVKSKTIPNAFDSRRTGSVVDGSGKMALSNTIQKAQNLKEKFMKHKEKQVNQINITNNWAFHSCCRKGR